jgi:hypothetical protein
MFLKQRNKKKLKDELYRVKSDLLRAGATGTISVNYSKSERFELIYVYIIGRIEHHDYCNYISWGLSFSSKDYTKDMIDLYIKKVFPGYILVK